MAPKTKTPASAITANGTEVNEDDLLYKMDAAELAGVNEGYLFVLAKKNPTLAGGVVKDTYPGSSHARWRISRQAIEQWRTEQQGASAAGRPRGGARRVARRVATIEVLTPDQISMLQAFMDAQGFGKLGPIYKARTAGKHTADSNGTSDDTPVSSDSESPVEGELVNA